MARVKFIRRYTNKALTPQNLLLLTHVVAVDAPFSVVATVTAATLVFTNIRLCDMPIKTANHNTFFFFVIHDGDNDNGNGVR